MPRDPGLYLQAVVPIDHAPPIDIDIDIDRAAAQRTLQRQADETGVRLTGPAVLTTVGADEEGRFLLLAWAPAETVPLPPAGSETDVLITERFGLAPVPDRPAPDRLHPAAITAALDGVSVDLSAAEQQAAVRTGLARGLSRRRLRHLLGLGADELAQITTVTDSEGLVRAA